MVRNDFQTKNALLFFVFLFLVITNTFAQESNPTNVNVPDSIAEKKIIADVGVGTFERIQKKEILLANPFLSIMYTDGLGRKIEKKEWDWKITSYKVVFVHNGIESSPITVQGAKFPDEVISRIKSAPSGTNIEFSGIRINSSTAGARTIVNTIIVRIK